MGCSEIPLRWFAAGEPFQALLGIGEDYAALGRPVEHGGGLAGPPYLEGEDMVDVALRCGLDTVTDLAGLLPSVLLASREDWAHCQGCLELGPLSVSGRYCRACEFTYTGTIVD